MTRDVRNRLEKAQAAAADHAVIQQLLAAAQDDLQHDRLTTPEGSNAVERYRTVLERDPGNKAAQEGLVRVVDRYVALATSAIAGQKFDNAAAYLAKAEGVDPGNTTVRDARARLTKAKDATDDRDELRRRLADAERYRALSRQNIAMADDAAAAYRSVLALDANNQAALAGLDGLAGDYATLARSALAKGQLDQAERYLASAEKIAANHSELAAVRAEIEAAQATPSRLSFAVFPFQSLANCHYSVRDEVTDAVDNTIRTQPRASLDYSYYAAGADGNAIPSASKLWSDNAARRQPMLEAVRTAGRQLGVNGVLMVWYICSRSQYVAADTYEVEVYLVDVGKDRVFQSKMNFLDAGRAVSKVFDQFFAAYGIPGR